MENNGKFLYKKESFDIIDACQEVWKEFGGSFKEVIVDRALEIALRNKGYKIDSQKRIDIYFKNEKVGVYVPDKIINEIILLELKCKPFIAREDEKQFWHYLKASSYKLGFLINFSPKKLEFRRRVYDMARKAQ
ncbi:GxxExxY protein [Patescibacteria group bacterium]|nr:GxxExxY protein [Patescibacteria group bacterium]MBU2265142.1 GxxExxY protein [Patescibacteria group bacterium]